jgi:dCMP deaminase
MNSEYLSWEEAFIALAKLVLLRSKRNANKTGSCIVDGKNRIMSLGYDGLPMGCNDNLFPHEVSNSIYDNIDTYILPSITNAILLARRNLEGCSLYTTDFPCSEATKMIIQNGLNKIYYINNYLDNDDYLASLKMLDASHIFYSQLADLEVEVGNNHLTTWDETYIGLSKLLAMRSKDPNTQVGSCIIDKDNRIISLGYNGLPYGCDDKDFPWECRQADHSYETKYPYAVHAETNAISIAHNTSPRDLENAKVYVTLFPCSNCAAKIIQAGIK